MMMFYVRSPLAAIALMLGAHARPVRPLPLPGSSSAMPVNTVLSTDTGGESAPLPRLTNALLTQLETLGQAVHHLSPAVQDSAKAFMASITPDIQVPGMPPVGGVQGFNPVINWGAFAAHSQPVAAAFARAHLAPRVYLPLLRAMFSAYITLRILGAFKAEALADTSLAIVPDTTTVVEKNVEFAHLHQALMKTVASTFQQDLQPPPGTPGDNGTPPSGLGIPLF
jgi:hypothetical protein